MQDWLASFPLKKFSIFVVLIVAFVYNVLFEGNVQCICKTNNSKDTDNTDHILNCVLYMLLPCLIIWLLMIWTNDTCFKACRFCRCPCGKNGQDQNNENQSDQVPHWLCCELTGCPIFKALLVSLLWFLSVLIDGDWAVCCWNDTSVRTFACKEESNLSAKEKVNITLLKNKSRASDDPSFDPGGTTRCCSLQTLSSHKREAGLVAKCPSPVCLTREQNESNMADMMDHLNTWISFRRKQLPAEMAEQQELRQTKEK